MKMGLLVFLLSGILIFFSFSCKKDSTFEKKFVTGIVLHSVTKQPLVNQRISVWVTTYKLGKKNPPEWPDGEPIYTNKNYIAVTDAAGNYRVDFEVDGEWIFSAALLYGDYIQQFPRGIGYFGFPQNKDALRQATQLFATIYGERPGFITYHIQNINDRFDNDTILTDTYYKNHWIGNYNPFSFPHYENYNMVFPGAIVQMEISDTIPAESMPQVPVKWLHRRIDTIILRNEIINVQPNSRTDYYIRY